MTEGTNIIGYVRVSTSEQGESGAGLEAQRAAIVAEAGRRGWHVVRIAEDVASGKSTNGRHGLTDAVAAIEAGEAQALVAAKLDRVSRSALDFANLADRAKRKGWALVVLDLGVDMTTPVGEMIAGVLSYMAQFERRIIAQRTKDGLAAKRAKTAKAGRYSEEKGDGLLKGPVGRPRQLPPDVRDRIHELHAGGMSRNAIARLLTEEGVATAHGGKRWYDSTVRRVLEVPTPS